MRRSAPAGVVVLALFGLALAPRDAEACSLISFPAGRSPEVTYLIVTPGADTAAAGIAAAHPDWRRAHWHGWRQIKRNIESVRREKAWRRVYGQHVRIDRVGGRGASELAALLAKGRRSAVLVPWSTGANCGPSVWGTPARWLPVDSAVFVVAVPRPRSAWVDGRPTFDVYHGSLSVYPSRHLRQRHARSEASALPMLSLAEYWDLYEARPIFGSLEQRRAPDRFRTLWTWAARNPHLAQRFPATEVLRNAAHHSRLR